MQTQHHTILQTSNLTIGYPSPRQVLLQNLNLTLSPRELVCFMGPNGIGKSTLIRTLAGLQTPLSGKIEIATPTALQKTGMHQQVSVVLTDRITTANMTVYELITFGRYPYLGWNIKLSDADKEIIEQSIDHIHLGHLVDKKIYSLSDGQLQMVMIARALTQDTPVILLDEPTAHLDLNNRVGIMKLLRDLTRSMDKAILIATHDLDLALQTADHIWLADHDRHIRVGLPEDLVLNGSFDEVFKFKGFDLKTGKVQHEATRDLTVTLKGDGHEFRWTKNALERTGFKVTTAPSPHTITLHRADHQLIWSIQGQSFSSVESLLNFLATITP